MAAAEQTGTYDIYIDHVTILLSKEDFESPPAWLTDNFTLFDGGDHTGKASRIKLIVFKDGTYLELFSWKGIPPSNHPWGIRDPGLLDFALSTAPPSTATSNWERLNTEFGKQNGDGQLGVRYGRPKAGGRKTPSGVQLEWETTHPEYFDGLKTPASSHLSRGRIEVPFWCHDKTERRLRAPSDDAEKTTHPCGATGIAQVEILVPHSRLREYAQLYETVTGSSAEPALRNESDLADASGYVLRTRSPYSADPRQRIWIHPSVELDEASKVKQLGIGLAGLHAKVEGQYGQYFRRLSEEGTGSKLGLVG